jgi:phosphatidylserine decarboxylase
MALIARAGVAWVLFGAAVAAVGLGGGILGGGRTFLALAGLGGALLVLFLPFFRDPERAVGMGVVAPADGKVLVIQEEGRNVRIGTFMNVTDVHVNRTPLGGYLVRIDDISGPRNPAYSSSAGKNARKRYLFGTPVGVMEVIQITGIVARRCQPFHSPGRGYRKGERFGMILFGSRVDVLLPRERVQVRVHLGERVWAGTSTLADLRP